MKQEQEYIVFIHNDGTPTGEVGPKLVSHTNTTKLHLAFSCYIFRSDDHKLLVTQRALGKKVWPGAWTNSLCGHPGPGEPIEQAIDRRAMFELGIHLEGVRCVIPTYRYTTPPYAGIIENEFCPIFIAYTSETIRPNPKEVEEFKWMGWQDYIAMLHSNKCVVSYWAKDQYKYLNNKEPFLSLEHSAFVRKYDQTLKNLANK